MKPWKTLARETVLNFSRFLTVEKHTIELPDGRIIPDWPWVITPDYVNIVAVTAQYEFLCFRQTKYAANGITLAPVGGMIDPGETPLQAATRELREEMGLAAGELVALGQYANDGNRGVGIGHLYLALDCVPVGKTKSDDLEEQQVVRLSLNQFRQALLAGEFKIMSWSANAALALIYLTDRQYPQKD